MNKLENFKAMVEKDPLMVAAVKKMGCSLNSEKELKRTLSLFESISRYGMEQGVWGFSWYSETGEFWNEWEDEIVCHITNEYMGDPNLENAMSRLSTDDIVRCSDKAKNYYVWFTIQDKVDDILLEIE